MVEGMIRHFTREIKRGALAVINWIAPGSCFACEMTLICEYCLAHLHDERARSMYRLVPPPGVRRILGVGPYRAPLDQAVLRLKHQQPALARGLAFALCHLHQEHLATWRQHKPIIVPIALHPERLQMRGYNQSIELAREMSSWLGFELQRAALLRVGPLRVQHASSGSARQAQLIDSFTINPRVAPYLAGESAKGRPIILVDDVITTGATLTAASIALRRAGIHTIDAAVIAWAMPRY
jgi:ComF family protein